MNVTPKPWLSTFRCPRCGAFYQVVRIEEAETHNQSEVNCLVCAAVFPNRDGLSFLRYFLTHTRTESRRCQ